MPATPWTELTGAAPAWLDGFVDPTIDPLTDLYVDVLFEGTLMLAVIATPATELSLSVATPTTELTTPATAYVELSL